MTLRSRSSTPGAFVLEPLLPLQAELTMWKLWVAEPCQERTSVQVTGSELLAGHGRLSC